LSNIVFVQLSVDTRTKKMTKITKRRQANLLVDVAVVFYVHLLMTSESHGLDLSKYTVTYSFDIS
jgi:hypothetical protein